jgi:sarcosine oxidase / L-pipecolate oxidase
MESSDQFDFIVVGGGCAATSTMYAIIQKWPSARVAWFTGVHENTASNDFLKIIRDAYPDDIMSEWASRSLRMWSSNNLYSKHFHQTAWIQAIDKETRKTMTKGQNDQMVTVKEMMERVGSIMEPSLIATEGLYLNQSVGYADSDVALQAVSDTIVELGVHVQRRKENITRLIVDPEGGTCVGVEVGDIIVRGNTTIVSTGAWTPSLLEKSKIITPPGFFQVTAVGVAVIELSDSEFDSLKSMPILVTENGKAVQPDLTTADF